jgi:hypothetical protein
MFTIQEAYHSMDAPEAYQLFDPGSYRDTTQAAAPEHRLSEYRAGPNGLRNLLKYPKKFVRFPMMYYVFLTQHLDR